jgi:hypothetical protein
MVVWFQCDGFRTNAPLSACLRRSSAEALVLFVLLLHAAQTSVAAPSAEDCATSAREVSFAANSAGSDGEFQPPALNPEGWEVKKFEQVQRCMTCRYAQETSAGSADAGGATSAAFGSIMMRTCPSLPPFLKTPCNDAAAAINKMPSTAALGDLCHAAKVCSVPMVDPFETAKFLASSCDPSRCTIHHHVGLLLQSPRLCLTPSPAGASQHHSRQHVAPAPAHRLSHASNRPLHIWPER